MLNNGKDGGRVKSAYINIFYAFGVQHCGSAQRGMALPREKTEKQRRKFW